MSLQVLKSSLIVIDELRRQRRSSIDCQIVRDSILARGLAAPYLFVLDGVHVGYAGVWIRHFPDRVMEFYLRDDDLDLASEAFDCLVSESGATEFEAQTNIPAMNSLLDIKCTDIKDENLLFCNGPDSGTIEDNSHLPHERTFRHRRAGDTGPEGAWVVEINQRVVAAGGFLRHYNPPFGDIFMEVIPEYRRQGIGSYLVVKLRQHAAEVGIEPAARCDADNEASIRTLEKGGMKCCGSLRAGKIKCNTPK